MADDEKTNLRMAIAHVLFMDIVSYSTLLIDEQSEAVHELNRIVRGTGAVREAEAAGQVVILPTGDGMALVFTGSVEAPVECALQISQAIRAQPSLPLRMGIHSGPVHHVVDVNGRENIAGVGINVAQRVMDCGDAGHILISQRVADDLLAYRHWQPYLHPLGDCEVKHGLVVSLVNLYADVIGNPVPPVRFGGNKAVRRNLPPGGARKSLPRWAVDGIALLVIGLLVFALWRWGTPVRPAVVTVAPPAASATPMLVTAVPAMDEAPEKSIAVLPFDSLSADKENAFFAEGMQDEILTDLAKVADLKVISRTSVLAFRAGGARDLREIGRALGVSHLLEGSVQRAGGKVRVTAKLIDIRTSRQVWADHYDEDLADVFAIQTRMAEQIVASLKARLSPEEKQAIDARPTESQEAYALYLQAKDLLNEFQSQGDYRDPLLKTVSLLDDALSKDPNFALAYCLAARAHDQLYWLDIDRTTARLAREEAAVAQALRLKRDLGEAHLARAVLLFHGYLDFAGARDELAVARRTLPNSPDVLAVTAYLDRRQGRWPEAVRNQEKAVSLDPRNGNFLYDLAVLYDVMRLYREELRVADAAMTAVPKQAPFFRLTKAQIYYEMGQPAACRTALSTLPADLDPSGGTTYTRVAVALGERHFGEASQALAATKGERFSDLNSTMLPRAWLEALIFRAAGDQARAKTAMLSARQTVEEGAQGQPEDASTLALLGRIDAGLGRKEDAWREGRRAVELRPVSVDTMGGAAFESALALIYAWTGETEQALALLGPLSTKPGGPHYGELRFDPAWDVLRGNPRFEALVAAMEPK